MIDLERFERFGRDWVVLLAPRLSARKLRTTGGPGSGNFGHAGRPGEVGGSAPGDGGHPQGGEVSKSGLDHRFPAAQHVVDGREIPDFDDEFGPDIPNMSSISASLESYEILDGVREVKMSEFEDNGKPSFYSRTERERTEALAAKIEDSKTITPLIIVVDADKRGPYVLEGGHRFDALRLIGAKSFPALVVVDTSELEIRTLGGQGSGYYGHAGRPGQVGGSAPDAGGSGIPGEKKKKAPKAPPVPLESKKSAYDEVKKGATFKATAAKYGMTQGQLSGYVWKVDQAKKKTEEALEEQQAAESIVKAPIVTEKPWAEMSSDEKLTYAHDQGYEWKPKPESKSGNYAWYDKEGHQVSGFGQKETYREKLDTINYGAGIVPKVPDAPAPTGKWPISNETKREMNDGFVNEMSAAHGGWVHKLTSGERDAIESYTGSTYAELNQKLREGGGLSSYYAVVNSKLNSAIAKAPTPPPPDLVWRGLSSDNALKLFGGLKNGDTLTMKGFQSSSIKPQFAHSWGGGKILFEIKPSSGIYAKLLSHHPHEYEYLLPHNAKYTVRGVTHVKFQGVGSPVRVIQLEMH